MENTLGIAGIQLNVKKGTDNSDRMIAMIENANQNFPWVDLVVFSELCISGFDISSAETIPGPATEKFCETAQKFNKWIIPGSLFEKSGEKIFNTAVVISPEGEIVAKYRKMFPWRPIETNDRGDEFCIFDIPERGRFGIAICYDQWFPEVIRTLSWMGAEVIIHPTMTTTSDRVIELTLSQAHAAFNQLYFISINGVSSGGNGKSIFIDPDGRVLQTSGAAEEAILTEIIDFNHVKRTRRMGTLGLCHPLRELQNAPLNFPCYTEGLSKGKFFEK